MKQTTKSARIVKRFLKWDEPFLTITLIMSDGKVTYTDYRVEETGSDAGRGWKLWRFRDGEQVTSEQHEVHLGGEGYCHCTCKAFEHGRGEPCKHICAFRSLLALDLLGSRGVPGSANCVGA